MTEYTFYVCVNDAEHRLEIEAKSQEQALEKCKNILDVQPDDEFEILEIRTDEVSE